MCFGKHISGQRAPSSPVNSFSLVFEGKHFSSDVCACDAFALTLQGLELVTLTCCGARLAITGTRSCQACPQQRLELNFLLVIGFGISMLNAISV